MPDTNSESFTITREQFDVLMQQAREVAAVAAPPSRSSAWLRSMGKYIGARLAEPTTYAGIALLASAIGVHLDPERLQALSQVGPMLAGIILAASKDTGNSA